jgi:hypothetical protein
MSPARKSKAAGPDDKTLEALSQAFSRLTVHEFMLEIMMANWLVTLSQQQADELVAEIRRLSKTKSLTGQPAFGDEWITRWMADARELQDNFLDKVIRRAAGIREALAREGLGQPKP